jgi:hypothetical protein
MIFLAISFIACVCPCLLIRNVWVHDTRMQWLDEIGCDGFARLASYERMLFTFWRWSNHPSAWRIPQ